MMHQRIILPAPWYGIELFDLVEPVRETSTEVIYRKRLYMVERRTEGGRVLIKSGPEFAMPKVATPETGGGAE